MNREVTQVKLYSYKNCSTCRKAGVWLRERGIGFEERPIRETPPDPEELRRVLVFYDGDLRRLFNTSGQDYRALNMKERLPGMSVDEAIALLAENGNLVKRPFLVTSSTGRAGFKEEEWKEMLGVD